MADCFHPLNNPVPGVPGVPGRKWRTRHMLQPRCGAGLRGSVPGVPGPYVCGRARMYIRTPKNRINKFSRAYMYPAHPAHPAQTTDDAGCGCAGYFYAPAHPAQTPFIHKKIMKIICGKENVESFNAELRKACPDFYRLVKTLFASGLMSGLGGATLERPPYDHDEDEIESPRAATARFCCNCHHFLPDKVGDGSGIGQCAVGGHKNRLKWPKLSGCWKWEEK